MADLKKTIEILFEGNDQASRKASDVIAKIKELETQASTTAPKVDNVSKSLDKIGAPATVSGISAATAALAAFGSTQLFDAFVKANTEVERFERGIKAIKGGQAVAGELDFIKTAANSMGLELGPAAAAYLKLTAAVQGTGLESSSKELFTSVATAIKATGGSSTEAAGAFKALEQSISKGKVTTEEMKGQLAEHLPGAMKLAATAMGATTAEFSAMLEKGIAVDVFIPKLIKTLNDTYGDKVAFDGYTENLNRLRNAINGLLEQAGKAGAFDLLTSGITGVKTVVGELGVSFSWWGGFYDALSRFSRDGSITGLVNDLGSLKDRTQQLANDMNGSKGINQTLAETNRLMRGERKAQADEADNNQSGAETNRLKRLEQDAIDAERETKRLNDTLKALGVDPKKTDDGVKAIEGLLRDLANNPKANGTDFVLAVEASLKKVATSEQLTTIKTAVEDLFKDGKIDAATYEKALADIDKAGAKLAGGDGGLKKSEKAAEDAAKAMAQAEKDAKAWALEMEKIASNERIKIIEAKVQIDIANAQEQTKRIEAAFESINTAIDSTGKTITDLFGLVGSLEGLDKLKLFDQIEAENERRDEAFRLQKELTEATIAQMRAQTEAMNRGDSLITIQGDGLKPHLEAFMWEILRAIQVRVNADGLKLLLGT